MRKGVSFNLLPAGSKGTAKAVVPCRRSRGGAHFPFRDKDTGKLLTEKRDQILWRHQASHQLSLGRTSNDDGDPKRRHYYRMTGQIRPVKDLGKKVARACISGLEGSAGDGRTTIRSLNQPVRIVPKGREAGSEHAPRGGQKSDQAVPKQAQRHDGEVRKYNHPPSSCWGLHQKKRKVSLQSHPLEKRNPGPRGWRNFASGHRNSNKVFGGTKGK